MKKVLTILFLVSIFLYMKPLLRSSSYQGPQVRITNQPSYLLPNQIGNVEFEISFPIEEGTDMITGSFDVRGSLPPGNKSFSARRPTRVTWYDKGQSPPKWVDDDITPNTVIPVVGMGTVSIEKNVGLIGKKVTVTGTTIPKGHEDLIQWKALLEGEVAEEESGGSFGFTPDKKGPYIIIGSVGEDKQEVGYVAVTAIFKLISSSPNVTISNQEITGGQTLYSPLEFISTTVTEPKGLVSKVLGTGATACNAFWDIRQSIIFDPGVMAREIGTALGIYKIIITTQGGAIVLVKEFANFITGEIISMVIPDWFEAITISEMSISGPCIEDKKFGPERNSTRESGESITIAKLNIFSGNFDGVTELQEQIADVSPIITSIFTMDFMSTHSSVLQKINSFTYGPISANFNINDVE